MKHLATLLAATLLAGCGGSSDPVTATAAAAVACIAPTSTIQLFGDSTQLLAAPYWAAKWGPRVTSNAVGSTNSTQLRAGTDGLNKPWPGSVTADWVVIKHGTNDGTAAYGLTPISVYKDNLRFFVAHTGAHVILETPDPSTEAERATSVPPYTAAMREVALELHVPLIDTDTCWRAHAGWESFVAVDGTHANAEGRQFTVDTCVAPVVAALACQ